MEHCSHCIPGDEGDQKKSVRRLILSIVLTIPLFLSMVFPVIPNWVQLILSGIVQFVCGWEFYTGSFAALKRARGDMDLLIALGSSAAFFYSAGVTLFQLPYPTYFETSATIITLVLLGRYLERKSQASAGHAVEGLYKLQPHVAKVKREGEW